MVRCEKNRADITSAGFFARKYVMRYFAPLSRDVFIGVISNALCSLKEKSINALTIINESNSIMASDSSNFQLAGTCSPGSKSCSRVAIFSGKYSHLTHI